MKRFLFALAGVAALLAVPTAGSAARVEADPNKEYPITPEAGPFAICVKAYSGDEAHELANRLVLHLRQNGWMAFTFDYTPEEERKAREWLEERYKNIPPEARPHRGIRVQQQWGVFIGGYRDFDSASGDIARVRKTPEPPQGKALDIDHFDPTTRQIYHLNTYAQCIATRNPTVRAPKPDASAAADPAWKRLNEGRPYNLLKCAKPWTLVVKQFQTPGVIQPRSASSQFLNMVGLGDKGGDVLEANAAQAEEVAKVLNKQFGYETFVLHTRTSSIVTVGAYDTKDDKALLQAAIHLRNLRFGPKEAPYAIQLFEQPLPMAVPRL
jgi:hypothetical protein